jgi:hypothetical protein
LQDIHFYRIILELYNENQVFEYVLLLDISLNNKEKLASLINKIPKNLSAIISTSCYGQVEILFNDSIDIYKFELSQINSSNTDIMIIPYYNPILRADINYTQYNFTWNTTSITSYKLTIQLYFSEPDAVSKFSV